MPRGIYDRTKTKEQRTAEKETSTEAPKKVGRPAKNAGRKVVAKEAAPKVSKAKKVAKVAPVLNEAQSEPTYSFANKTDSIYLFSTIRENLNVLLAVAEKFGGSTVTDEINAHLAVMKTLREEAFPTKSTETIVETATAETTEDVEKDEVVSATPSNGQYSNTVPLPPTPPSVPSMPTH